MCRLCRLCTSDNVGLQVRSKSPGPGAYSSLSSVGQQSLSARRSMPSSSFGKAKREQVHRTAACGVYRLHQEGCL